MLRQLPGLSSAIIFKCKHSSEFDLYVNLGEHIGGNHIELVQELSQY